MQTSSIINIKKRTGEIADFNPGKILIAISKAFAHVDGSADSANTQKLTDEAIKILEERFKEKTPAVEDVQDVVEQILMEAEHFEVAKAYIIYRYEHEQIREEKKKEVKRKLENEGIFVIKRSGEKELFSMEKLVKSIKHYAKDHEDVVNIEAVANKVCEQLYEDVPTEEIEKDIVVVLRSMIQEDAAYAYAAAKALITRQHRYILAKISESFRGLENDLQEALSQNVSSENEGIIDSKVLGFEKKSDKTTNKSILQKK